MKKLTMKLICSVPPTIAFLYFCEYFRNIIQMNMAYDKKFLLLVYMLTGMLSMAEITHEIIRGKDLLKFGKHTIGSLVGLLFISITLAMNMSAFIDIKETLIPFVIIVTVSVANTIWLVKAYVTSNTKSDLLKVKNTIVLVTAGVSMVGVYCTDIQPELFKWIYVTMAGMFIIAACVFDHKLNTIGKNHYIAKINNTLYEIEICEIEDKKSK